MSLWSSSFLLGDLLNSVFDALLMNLVMHTSVASRRVLSVTAFLS
jgi:hypothetical protein